jgi:xanthine dehydrogenase YagT iron-sulfur-binding subunit
VRLPSATVPLRLELNGQPIEDAIDPRLSLLDWLRETRVLTGAKRGCDRGQCGACTVLVDGERMVSCLLPAASLHNRSVTTIEGFKGEPLAAALIDELVACDGLQCGFCTPGQIAAAHGAIRELEAAMPSFVTPTGRDRGPLIDELRERLSGNLCRCGAYLGIREAVLTVARRRGLQD